jgi:hypothetical protein
MTIAHQAPGGVEQPLARAEIRLDGGARDATGAPADQAFCALRACRTRRLANCRRTCVKLLRHHRKGPD